MATAPETNSYPAPSFIDPATLMQIQSLELRAKGVVEGFFSGFHRSPFHGFSVEFTEYRQYVTGDDLRYLDWKLYARSDRYYIKRYEDETNLRCYLLLDNSRSLTYGSLAYTKADYAKTLAGTLAYFLNTQRDAVGLFRFSETLDEFLPPRHRPGHLRRLLAALESQPDGKGTGLISTLEQVAQRVRKRGLFLLLTDFLTSLENLESRLGYLRATGSEVIAFQILDPAELSFPFSESALFVDAETGQEVYVDPQIGRAQYQQKFQAHQSALNACCERVGVTLVTLSTETPLEHGLGEFLRMRTRLAKTRQ